MPYPHQSATEAKMVTTSTEMTKRTNFTRKQATVVLLCLIFIMVDGFDITAMAVAASSIGTELGLDPDQLGLVFSFALAGMMFGAMLLAPISDVIGRRLTIIAGLGLVGSTVVITGYAQNLELIIVLRFFSGLGAGAILACQATLASEYVPEKYRALAVSIVTAGYPLGAMLTGMVAHYLIPLYGWQGLFIGGGTAALLLAMIAYLALPESIEFLIKRQPKNALEKINKLLTSLSRPNLTELPQCRDGNTSPSVNSNVKALLTADFRPYTLLLWTVFFLCFATLYFLMSWIPKLVLLLGYSENASYSAFTIFNLGGVIGIFTLGVLSTRLDLIYLIAGFLCLSGLLMMLVNFVAQTQSALLALVFIIGVAQQGGFTGLYSVATKIYPTEIRATGMGWAVGLGRSGAVVGPAVAGLTIAGGVSAESNFLLFSIPMIIGGLMATRLAAR